jgi:hypothetical protein
MDTNIPNKPTDGKQINMTRLNGVKAACIESLDNLKTQEPNKRVALVTFSDSVKYYGDSTKKPSPLLQISNGGHPFGNYGIRQQQQQQQQSSFFGRIQKQAVNAFSSVTGAGQVPQGEAAELPREPEIAADIMDNKEKMIALATNQDGELKPVSATHGSLVNMIKGLRTEGSTALGPGLTFSIGLTSKKSGSQIILCTDGCANVGMGSIETGNQEVAEKFYDTLADYAKSKGVSVNVITMEGTDCKLALLGKVADKTNGTMNIVNPLNLGEQFRYVFIWLIN